MSCDYIEIDMKQGLGGNYFFFVCVFLVYRISILSTAIMLIPYSRGMEWSSFLPLACLFNR